MDDTLQRLKETAEACVKAYETWGGSRKNFAARESLQEAVHELRKVAARLEIEVAVSERDEMTQRPIPVPSHRTHKNRSAEVGNELPEFLTTDVGPEEDDPNDRQPDDNQGGMLRRPQRSGGGGQGGGPRRPHGGGPRRSYQGGGQGSGPSE